MTDLIGAVYAKNDTELSEPIERGAVITKIRQENDMVNRTSVFYAENDTKLSGPIRPGAVCDEKQTGQQHDRSYICCLRQK